MLGGQRRVLLLCLQAGYAASFLTGSPAAISIARGPALCLAHGGAIMRGAGAKTATRCGPRARATRTHGASEQAGRADASDEEAAARRAAYLRDRDAREQRMLPHRVDMEHLFGEDTCPDFVERWGGMHRQAAMEGPTRKALEMAMDSEWATDSWADTPTPTSEPGTPTVSC